MSLRSAMYTLSELALTLGLVVKRGRLTGTPDSRRLAKVLAASGVPMHPRGQRGIRDVYAHELREGCPELYRALELKESVAAHGEDD